MWEWSQDTPFFPSPWSGTDVPDNQNEAAPPAPRRGRRPRRRRTGAAQASVVAGTLRELSVGLCRGNLLIYRASGGMVARVSSRGFWARLAVPTDETIE
jgi:hypothetical protein